ncbi:MAG: Maf family protein [Oscillospiraceae bacterium]|nr:Maf family protein [Oscillospiraceae bacterium]
MSIILASGSPRRKELMSNITDSFMIEISDVEEIIPENINPVEASEYLARLKAESIAEKYKNSGNIIIGCDTAVILDGEIMGKPRNYSQCFDYLSRLSGKMHIVTTGCCLIMNDNIKSFTEITQVYFRKLSPDEIRDYIATGEPYDKAGGYGIQGKGSIFVEKINGDFFNVMGLPVCRLNLELKELVKKI